MRAFSTVCVCVYLILHPKSEALFYQLLFEKLTRCFLGGYFFKVSNLFLLAIWITNKNKENFTSLYLCFGQLISNQFSGGLGMDQSETQPT